MRCVWCSPLVRSRGRRRCLIVCLIRCVTFGRCLKWLLVLDVVGRLFLEVVTWCRRALGCREFRWCRWLVVLKLRLEVVLTC